MIDPPVWVEGEPKNLSAASEDALQWLRLMSHFMIMGQIKMLHHTKNLDRLNDLIVHLETILMMDDANG